MTTQLDVQGRRTILYPVNKSGGSVALGDVVVGDASNDDAFTTTTTSAYIGSWVGVVIEANGIANNASGRVCVEGYVAQVNLSGSTTRGHFIKTHTVAKQGADAGATRVIGAFAVTGTTSATPTATLFGMPDGSTGSAGSPGTPALTLSTTNSAGVAVTLVATDATIAAFDATSPTTAAFGDAAVVGTAGFAARRDHKHGMPITGVVIASHVDTSGDHTTASATLGDMDATNAAVTFTAPASTNVIVKLFATVTPSATANAYVTFGLRESSSDIAGAAGESIAARQDNGGGGSPYFGVVKAFYLSGISAGSHTYKWSWASSSGTATCKANSNSPAIMEVSAA